MKHQKQLVVVFLALLMTMVDHVSMSFAQEASTDAPAEGSIREQQTTTQEQTLLQTYYRDQLEVYRAKEKAYQVAQEQLTQINTLAALEEAVQATKQAMISRDQVLQTYFKLLRLKLIDSHGVPIEAKSKAITDLAQLENNLKTHEQEVNQVTDRFTLAQSSTNFTLLAGQFETVTNHALCLIAFGNLQTVFDKTIALGPELTAKIKDKTTDFELAKKQRALTEIDLLSGSTKTQLDQIYAEVFTTKDNKPKVFSDHDLAQLTTKLQPVYAQLSQMHEFIDEVMKI